MSSNGSEMPVNNDSQPVTASDHSDHTWSAFFDIIVTMQPIALIIGLGLIVYNSIRLQLELKAYYSGQSFFAEVLWLNNYFYPSMLGIRLTIGLIVIGVVVVVSSSMVMIYRFTHRQ